MAKHLDHFKRRKKAVEALDGLFKNAEHVLVIHYSCESFYDRPEGRTPRVTSIAVRNLASGQTRSFSIHKVAEQKQVPISAISTSYDTLEREMLDEFFAFAGTHQHFTWVHWNMRDINYGFQAIEHRHRVLGGTPVEIQDSRKVDLARVLIEVYGVRYAGHPRLESIMKLNKISNRDFLVGKEEAAAWDSKDFVKLHQSTLRKVDIMANIAGRASNGTLEVASTFWERNGFHPAVVVELIKEHWAYSLVGFGLLAASVMRLAGVI